MRLLRTVVTTLALTTVVGSLSLTGGCKSRGDDSALLQNRPGGGGGTPNPPAPPNPPPGPGGQARVRMSVFDPANRANVDAYIRGFRNLQSTPQGRQVWEAMARIHQDFCPHGNWFFLPWHRVYLHHFEQVIAVASGKPDFALPYWDWDGNNRNRMPDDTLAANGLLWPARGPNGRSKASRMQPQNVGNPAMTQIMGSNNFLAFGSGRARGIRDPAAQGLLEAIPHNSTHVWVGGNNGDMSSFMSPRDPIFWMHHNNIDRIWTAWNRKQQEQGLPTVPPNGGPTEIRTDVWLQTVLQQGFQEPRQGSTAQNLALQPAARGYRVSETFDSAATFGYTFDNFSVGASLNDTQDVAVQAPVEYAPSFYATMALNLKQIALFDTQRAAVFVVDAAGSSGQDASGSQLTGIDLLGRAQQAAKSGKEPAIVLYVEGVPVPKNPRETSIEFYFNPDPQQKPEKNPDEFLGAFSFFATDHVHEGHTGDTLNLSFDLGRLMRERNITASAGGNLFVNAFLRYTDENGRDVTSQRELPNDLKPKLKAMKLRVEYSER